MGTTQKQKFKISRSSSHGSWVINDFEGSQPGIKVDSVVVNATRWVGSYVEGYIIAVHGISQEVAQGLDRDQLSDLGIGSQMRRSTARSSARGQKRLYLMEDGQVQGNRL